MVDLEDGGQNSEVLVSGQEPAVSAGYEALPMAGEPPSAVDGGATTTLILDACKPGLESGDAAADRHDGQGELACSFHLAKAILGVGAQCIVVMLQRVLVLVLLVLTSFFNCIWFYSLTAEMLQFGVYCTTLVMCSLQKTVKLLALEAAPNHSPSLAAGVTALPHAFLLLGAVPAVLTFLGVACLTFFSCHSLVRGLEATGKSSYSGVMTAQLGRWAAVVLDLSLVVNCFGRCSLPLDVAEFSLFTRCPCFVSRLPNRQTLLICTFHASS